MKNLIFVIAISSIFAMSSAFAPVSRGIKVVNERVQGEICFTIKNDSGQTITLHTGTGTTSLNNGVAREFCIKEGLELCIADKGRPGKRLLKVSQDIAGKKFKLSELM